MPHATNGRAKRYMSRCIALARRGIGRVEPNPAVGCLIVAPDGIIAEDWHRGYGEPHAEANALAKAAEAARGAELYVTLEPCSSRGKTPPCTDAILRAGIARVVFGAADRSQRGEEALREGGVDVVPGVMAESCRRLNPLFFRLAAGDRPYVVAKWAMSADGRIQTPPGRSKWISCAESRELVHRWRGSVDAVAVGIGTLLADDPLLTCRAGLDTPRRVVFDTAARTPLDSRLVLSVERGPVILVVPDHAPSRRTAALRNAGCKILKVPGSAREIDLGEALRRLHRQHGINTLMVEGGGRILTSMFVTGLVDEVRIFLAPTLLGGAPEPPPALPVTMKILAAALNDPQTIQHPSGQDLLLVSRSAPFVSGATPSPIPGSP